MTIHLRDILDIPLLQTMLDSLWRACGIPVGLLDDRGKVLVSTGWQRICTDYHIRHPEIEPRCILNPLNQSRDGGADSRPGGPCEIVCSSGLIDIILPICCEGEYLGQLFLGQFLDRPPDRERFRRYAAQHGFDPDGYLALLDEVPVIPRDRVDHLLDFHMALIRLLSESGLRKLREDRSNAALAASEQALRESEERFRSIVEETPLGIHMYRCDVDGRLVFVGYNPASDAILGVDNSQFLGKEILEAFPSLAGTDVPERYRQVCSSGESWQAEQINYSDGRITGAFEVHAFRTGPNRIASVFLDISERHRAMEKIRASESTLRSILAAAPLSIGLGHERVFSWVNRWMLNELGYAESELIGRNARMLYESEAEFERVGRVRAATVDMGQMGEVETRWLRRDASPVDVLLRFTRIEPADATAGVIFAALNITEARRAAREVQDSEERIRLLLESSAEAIFGVDCEGRCTFANPMCLELLGLTAEAELLGRRTHELMHHSTEDGAFYPEEECPVYSAYRTGASVHIVGEWFWRAGGRGFPVEYWAHPVIKEGAVVGAVVNFIDITERQRAERQLKEALTQTQRSREQVNTILRSVADALIVIDPFGQVLMANPAARELFGIDFDRAADRDVAKLIPDPLLLDRIGQAVAGTVESSVFDLAPWHGADGRERILQARVSAIVSQEEGLYGVVAILRDVTREREIDRLKDDFISTAAHELRTPITSILGYSEIMLDQLEALSHAQLREYLGVVCNRAEALTQIIEEMLDLSRMQSGQVIQLVRQSGNLGELARSAVNHYRAAGKLHCFRLEVDEPLPTLEFDEAKLHQVFDNLLSNATKFSPAESEIVIAVRRKGDEVMVTVTDRGVGMTASQVERIFDKFYRADASATAVSGLGLGMSLVKGIIEGHGGRIWVTSTPGSGTTVSFVLPAGTRAGGMAG